MHKLLIQWLLSRHLLRREHWLFPTEWLHPHTWPAHRHN